MAGANAELVRSIHAPRRRRQARRGSDRRPASGAL